MIEKFVQPIILHEVIRAIALLAGTVIISKAISKNILSIFTIFKQKEEVENGNETTNY